MATVFDAQSSTNGTNVTSLSIPAFTVGSGANRAVVAYYLGWNDTIGVAASLGADPGMSVISGTDGGGTTAIVLLGRITTLTGSQTASMSWTNSQINVVGGVMTFTGANQTTPFNNGTFGSAVSLSVTSTSGDLTTTGCAASASGNVQTGAGDTGPGTGTIIHTWTGAIDNLTTNRTRQFFRENGSNTSTSQSIYGISGVNVVQAAAAAGVPSLLMAPVIAA